MYALVGMFTSELLASQHAADGCCDHQDAHGWFTQHQTALEKWLRTVTDSR